MVLPDTPVSELIVQVAPTNGEDRSSREVPLIVTAGLPCAALRWSKTKSPALMSMVPENGLATCSASAPLAVLVIGPVPDSVLVQFSIPETWANRSVPPALIVVPLAPMFPMAVTETVPALMVIPPVNVLAPDSVSTPVPVLVRLYPPPMAADTVWSADEPW